MARSATRSYMRVMSIRSQRGFTIVELVVVITVLTILIGLVLVSLGSFYQSSTTSLTQTVQSTDTRSVLRAIENDLVTSSGFLTTTTMTPVTPTGSDNMNGAWSYKGNDLLKPNNRVLISRNYATDKHPGDETRSLVFCDGGPLVNNLVYFVAKDPQTQLYNLYRRTMVGTGTNCVGSSFQKQSCAPATVATDPPCKATDALLLYDVENFTIDYYATPDKQETIIDQYGAGEASIATAKSIKITVTTTRLLDGVSTPYSSSIRISRLN